MQSYLILHHGHFATAQGTRSPLQRTCDSTWQAKDSNVDDKKSLEIRQRDPPHNQYAKHTKSPRGNTLAHDAVQNAVWLHSRSLLLHRPPPLLPQSRSLAVQSLLCEELRLHQQRVLAALIVVWHGRGCGRDQSPVKRNSKGCQIAFREQVGYRRLDEARAEGSVEKFADFAD